jgi:hypothetical protein
MEQYDIIIKTDKKEIKLDQYHHPIQEIEFKRICGRESIIIWIGEKSKIIIDVRTFDEMYARRKGWEFFDRGV